MSESHVPQQYIKANRTIKWFIVLWSAAKVKESEGTTLLLRI